MTNKILNLSCLVLSVGAFTGAARAASLATISSDQKHIEYSQRGETATTSDQAFNQKPVKIELAKFHPNVCQVYTTTCNNYSAIKEISDTELSRDKSPDVNVVF